MVGCEGCNVKFALINCILFVKVKHLSFSHEIQYQVKTFIKELQCSNILYTFFFRGDLACNIALDAVRTVVRDQGDRKEIDIKNYAKVEKVSYYLKQF